MPSTGERQSVEEKLQILVDASATLLGSHRMEDLLPRVLDLARKLNAAEAAAIWRYHAETCTWKIASSIALSDQFRTLSITESTRTILGQTPICYEDVSTVPRIAGRQELYASEGIRSFMAMPMKIREEISGTLVFYYRETHQFSESEKHVATALANLAASAVETAELQLEQQEIRATSERARVGAAFLAEASGLLASSLDYETTLASVARLAVPQIADWCLVEIVQPDDSLKLLAVAHVDPAKVEWARRLRERYRSDPQSPLGPPPMVRKGRSVIRPEITDDMLVRRARDAEHLELMRGLGLTSYMCVPLEVRGRVVGVITFVSAETRCHYGSEDLTLAQDLARRAAMAVDNAMLYAAAQKERTAVEAALAALRENEQRLLLAMEAGRMGIWEWNVRTGELHWTENLLALHGLTREGFDGAFTTLLTAIHPEDRAQFVAAVERAVAHKTYFEREFRVVHPGSEVHWLVGKGRVLTDEQGESVRMIGIGMDVTERRLLEEGFRNSQKLESIGVLAGGVAHDFNNLLTGVLGNASLALELLPPGHEVAHLVQNVVNASERAAGLTQQLLAYAGKGRFVTGPMNLSALVGQIAELLLAVIPKLVRLELDLGDDLPTIEADSSQVQQIVMNLVINAAEAIGDRAGRILVRTGRGFVDQHYIHDHRLPDDVRAGSYVFLEVQDNGSGMDRETRERIFDPFFTTKFTGRGLGLAAVSGVVRGHHGAIHVESTPGQGSLFRALFPASGAPVAVDETPDTVENLHGAGLILVIDDEPAVRVAAQSALVRYGYRVVVANNGADGVEALRAAPDSFAAVLLDLTMPVLGGEKALRLMQEIRPDIPVIVSSGYSEDEASRRLPLGEVAGFLQKPYAAAALARKLKAALPKAMVQRRTES